MNPRPDQVARPPVAAPAGPPCPDADTFRAHQSQHYLAGDRWGCRTCEAGTHGGPATTGAPDVRWAAARDGIAHASRPGHARTLCGLVTIGEQLAWPERLRCTPCLVAAAEPFRAEPPPHPNPERRPWRVSPIRIRLVDGDLDR